tara:strand:+ start:304 stop:534 length:231 start_codon:yes stop_codon:yes gene_type:complete
MIKAKLSKEYLKCEMCAKNKLQDVYIWGSFAMLPEHPYYELKICKDCAVKDHGHKNKIKLNNIIEERTKQWLRQKK